MDRVDVRRQVDEGGVRGRWVDRGHVRKGKWVDRGDVRALWADRGDIRRCVDRGDVGRGWIEVMWEKEVGQ